MLNQMVLVGRIVQDPVVKETSKGKVSNITIAVPRAFKNEQGIYDTDFIDCSLWNTIAENTAEYCKKGDLVGIKGRLQTSIDDNGKKNVDVVAEKVTFLATKQKTNDVEQEKDIKI